MQEACFGLTLHPGAATAGGVQPYLSDSTLFADLDRIKSRAVVHALLSDDVLRRARESGKSTSA